jgi:radical SAM protein with 4Fe4S-binding SPASM domain
MKFIAGIAPFRPYLAFFGGEPFIRKDLLELVRFASNLGLLVWIGTNGTLLESQAEEIVQSGADYIYVSLDGPKQVNDAIRKGENVFERVTAGIRALVKAKNKLRSELPLIQIDMTIIRENHTFILETSRIAAELGADSFTVRYPIFTNNHLEKVSSDIFTKEFGIKPSFFKGFVRDFSGIDIAEIERQVAMVRKVWKSRFRPIPGGKNFSTDIHFNSPHLPHGNGRCFIPWVRAQVMPNGDVVLCEDYPEIVAGNIRKEEFLDIWNNDEYRHFRKFIKEKGILPVCNRCCGLYEVE